MFSVYCFVLISLHEEKYETKNALRFPLFMQAVVVIPNLIHPLDNTRKYSIIVYGKYFHNELSIRVQHDGIESKSFFLPLIFTVS